VLLAGKSLPIASPIVQDPPHSGNVWRRKPAAIHTWRSSPDSPFVPAPTHKPDLSCGRPTGPPAHPQRVGGRLGTCPRFSTPNPKIQPHSLSHPFASSITVLPLTVLCVAARLGITYIPLSLCVQLVLFIGSTIHSLIVLVLHHGPCPPDHQHFTSTEPQIGSTPLSYSLPRPRNLRSNPRLDV
jgi:hypothetical protein